MNAYFFNSIHKYDGLFYVNEFLIIVIEGMVMELQKLNDSEVRISTRIKNVFLNLANTYSNLSAPVKASMWFIIASIFQKSISMITIPIFTRILTTEQYGVFSVYQSWYSIISIFATLNLSYGVFNNGMMKYEEYRDKYTSSMQGLSTLITCTVFFVYLIAIDFWNNLFGLSTLFIIAMFVQLLFEPAYLFWTVRQRFSYKYKKLVVVTLILTIMSPFLGIIAVLSTTYKAEARVLSYVLVQVCVGLVFYIYNAYKGKHFFDREYWRFALGFNLPLVPHYLSASILGQSDRIMISNMVGIDKAAIYSVAYSISLIMTIVNSAINSSFVPYTYKAIKDKNYSGIEKNSKPLLLIVGAMALTVILFGPEIIKLFAPVEYYEAIWILPPVAVTAYFMFLYTLFANIEFYFEENRFIMIASVFGAALNIILNSLLIPVFGFIVAGYTTLLCYMVFAFMHYIFHKKILQQSIPGIKIYDIRFIIIVSVFLLAAMLLMILIYKITIIRYILIIILMLIIMIRKDLIINEIKNIQRK